MSDIGGTEASRRRGNRWLGRALVLWLVGALVWVLYVTFSASLKPDDGRPRPVAQSDLEALARGPLAAMEVPPVKRPAPATPFTGPDGAATELADARGRVLVVNLWATWCPPCRTEMPSLARLQQAYGNADVRVLAVSIDSPRKLPQAKAFIGANSPLAFHHSADAALAWALGSKAFPTTVIYDREGYERARIARPLEWDSPEIRALLDRLVAEPA